MSYPRYPKYKPSGVEWLGEVPESWGVKPIKSACTCNDDVLEENTPEDYEIEYIEISGVNSAEGIAEKATIQFGAAPSRARRRVQDGDVIVSTVRTYLRAIASVTNPPNNMIVSTGFAVVRPRTVEPRFLGYLFNSEYLIAEIIARSVGISYPAINASELIGLKIPFPLIAEQSAIAAFLDRETARIDALVEKKSRFIELLKEKRSALITHAVTKGLDPNVKMKDSGIEWLGEVPEHWGVKPIKFLVTSKAGAIKTGPFGSQLTSAEMQGGSIKVYNQRNVIDGDLTSGDSYITEDKFHQLASFQVFPGDILITTRGTIGKVAIVANEAEIGILHPCLMRVQVDESKISKEFFSRLLGDSHLLQAQIAYLSNASTIEVIYSETMASIILPVPTAEEQKDILNHLDRETARIDALVEKTGKSIELLKERRSALITAAVTGKIDVRQTSLSSCDADQHSGVSA